MKTTCHEAMRVVFNYYMRSGEWRSLRKRLLAREANWCQRCRCHCWRGYVAHHKGYVNWGKGNTEELNDLMLVCPECHEAIHKSLAPHAVPFWAKQTDRRLVPGLEQEIGPIPREART